MSIDQSIVRKVAKLAAIEIDEKQEVEFTKDLNDILSYVDKLGEAQTEGVEPTCHVHGSVNAFRDDVTKPSLSEKEIEKNAPDFVGSSFRVPRIISSS
jgi:aspartyl-tRNA(Asn)/glutamyl-tRNA(Gln) amidotransferase subunit C